MGHTVETKNIDLSNRARSIESASHADITAHLVSVISKERQALSLLVEHFPATSVTLVENILNSSGRLVISGHGKSGLIARKLVATFSSLGTPAFFLHPSDALHGDLGMVQPNDFMLVLSKSGTGAEFEQLLPVLRAQGNRTALMCCNKGALTGLVDLVIELPFEHEACEFDLAPTSSSTLMLAFGDAVALTLSKLMSFGKRDFARVHPAGALGRNLLFMVQHFMVPEASLPFLDIDSSFSDLIVLITQKKFGVGIVVSTGQQLLGIVTDGDLRRACKRGPDVFTTKAFDIMTPHPKTVQPDTPAYQALEIMEDFNITSLVVTNNRRVVGLVHIHDLIKAGIKR